jgi:hypothetical protein
MTLTTRGSLVVSRTSNWHFGSKLGQPCAEHAAPLSGVRGRSAFAKCCGGVCPAALAFLLGLFAAGAKVTAKAMTPATNTAAAIRTIGLNIVSPLYSRTHGRTTRARVERSAAGKVKSNTALRSKTNIAFELSIYHRKHYETREEL